jgi:hypothetical protein
VEGKHLAKLAEAGEPAAMVEAGAAGVEVADAAAFPAERARSFSCRATVDLAGSDVGMWAASGGLGRRRAREVW